MFCSFERCFYSFWLASSLIPVSTDKQICLDCGQKVSRKQNLLVSFSHTLLKWSGWNLVLCWSSLSWTCLLYFRMTWLLSGELLWWHGFGCKWNSIMQTWVWWWCWTLHFDSCLINLTLIQCHRDAGAPTYCWLFRCIGLINQVLTVSPSIDFQRWELCWVDFVCKR